MRENKDFIGAYLRYAQHHERPIIYKRWSAIAGLAAVIGRKLCYKGIGNVVFPNLYVFLVGGPSTRKSSAAGDIVRLYQHVFEDNEAMAPITQMTDLGLYKKLADMGSVTKYRFQGKEYRYSPVFIYGSELKETMRSLYDGGALNTTLTDLYNCGMDDSDGWRTISARQRVTGNKPTVKVYNPCVNILACSTASWLTSSVLSPSDIEGGFGSRLILACYPGIMETKRSDVQQQPTYSYELDMQLKQTLKHISKLEGIYTHSADWWEFYQDKIQAHNTWMNQTQSSDPMLVNMLCRKVEPNLIKLSMLIAASESDELVLKESHAVRAWGYLEELQATLPYAFENIVRGAQARVLNDIWNYLEGNNIRRIPTVRLHNVFKDRDGEQVRLAMLRMTSQLGWIKYSGDEVIVERDFDRRNAINSVGRIHAGEILE